MRHENDPPPEGKETFLTVMNEAHSRAPKEIDHDLELETLALAKLALFAAKAPTSAVLAELREAAQALVDQLETRLGLRQVADGNAGGGR
jgi:hypothetical protein